MCTTIRKLRRGTLRGIKIKLFKRHIIMQLRNIRNAMASDRTGDVSELLAKFSMLNKLKRSVKI